MDVALKRHPLLVTALAPLIPHLLGSAFNIWYNMTVIDPLLPNNAAKQVFDAMWSGEGSDVDAIVDAKGLKQMTDTGALEQIVAETE